MQMWCLDASHPIEYASRWYIRQDSSYWGYWLRQGSFERDTSHSVWFLCAHHFRDDIIHVPASPRLHANQADEVFWRVGDKSRKLPFEERLQLMYDKGERYYEDSPACDATIEDIDMDAVKAYMKRIGYGKSPMEYLQENKGFLTYKGDVPQVSQYHLVAFIMKASVWANVLEKGQENETRGQEKGKKNYWLWLSQIRI